ncbi:hypothetical protein E2320_012851 [Naja naja]|nr:hypothetical protein E2320_012851 [Naja naja]
MPINWRWCPPASPLLTKDGDAGPNQTELQGGKKESRRSYLPQETLRPHLVSSTAATWLWRKENRWLVLKAGWGAVPRLRKLQLKEGEASSWVNLAPAPEWGSSLDIANCDSNVIIIAVALLILIFTTWDGLLQQRDHTTSMRN